MPNDPTICAASVVAVREVAAGPVPDSPMQHLLGDEAAERDRDARLDLGLACA